MTPTSATLTAADLAAESARTAQNRADEARRIRDHAILMALKDGHDRPALARVTGLSYSYVRKIDEASA